MTMVGDAYAAPIVEELQRGSYDLSSLLAIGTGGAATNPKYPARSDGGHPAGHPDQRLWLVRNREHGVRAQQARQPDRKPSSSGRAAWLCPRTTRGSSSPANTEVGWVARGGRIPLGYFNDSDATRNTFPEVAGSARGDIGRPAAMEDDGTLRLFGRDSLVVNHRRREVCSLRRSRKSLRPIRRSRMRWWLAGQANAGARKSSRWWRCATASIGPNPRPVHFTRTAL